MAPTPSPYSDWASLPKQLLDKILDDHLVPMADCIRFSAVCKDWYCVAADNFKDVGGKNQRLHQQQLPFLMVSTYGSTDSRCLYDVTRKGLYEFQLKIPYNVSCGGCSHGWLITVADDSFEVTLFNPFSGKSILLPPLRRLLYEKRHSEVFRYMSAVPRRQWFEYEKRLRREYEEEDIGEYQEFDQAFDAPRSHQSKYSIAMSALSVDPDVNMNGYALMVIYGLDSRLAFIKSGDENWTYIDRVAYEFYETIYADPIPHSGLNCLEDLICRPNGIFYVLVSNGVVFSIDFQGGKQTIKLIAERDEKEMFPFRQAYLVESPEGDIFRILRRDNMGPVERLTIQKLVESSDSSSPPQQWRWRKVETIVDSLRDVSLFLGRNHAICVTASDFSGCQPNSIFFYDDDYYYFYTHEGSTKGSTNTGVCHLHGESITRHGSPYYCHWQIPQPIWILPKFAFPTINICLAS